MGKKEFLILTAILLVGAFLRLYKIDQYMTFLGDEGRDVIVVRRLLVNFDPILIGPGTSIGNMYLGPLYYYMMAPALFLAQYSPMGPAVQIALLGVLTIWFVWFIGRKWWGQTAGLIAASLYAISPTVIIYSRSSWNPNIMPFFSLLTIYSLWKIWSHSAKDFAGWGRWLIVLGISYAFCLQSHYLGLLLAPTILIFLFLSYRKIKERRSFFKLLVIGFSLFAFLMSPLVIFDARHGWRNFASMKKFFTVRQETVSIKPWNAIPKAWPIFRKATTSLVAANNKPVGLVVSLTLFVFFIWSVFKRKNSLLIVWIGFALLGLGLYKQEIYDHYYGFFFAAPFLLLGGLAQAVISDKRKKTSYIFIACCLLLVAINLLNNPLHFPSQQLKRAKVVAQKVSEEAKGNEFNFAVIAERNYESGYRYFLEMWKQPVVDIDAQKPGTITDQLFVVCEMPKEKCDPTHNPKAEVANFGWSKVENQDEVFGTRVYKLVHTEK